MTGRPRIITDNQALFKHYNELTSGDIVRCRVRLRPGEEHLLLDLSARGVIAVPSFLSQLCSRSKVLQTRLFSSTMLPGTRVVYTLHDLVEAVNAYGADNVREVIVKLEGKNAGLGVLKYFSIEDVYSQSVLKQIQLPFIIQPFLPAARDLRIIVIDDYVESYERSNPHTFRNNLHCGGTAKPVSLSGDLRELCAEVMERGMFPYAHIDLMIAEDGTGYFSEINLRGGLRGARIKAGEYRERIEAVEEKRFRELL